MRYEFGTEEISRSGKSVYPLSRLHRSYSRCEKRGSPDPTKRRHSHER